MTKVHCIITFILYKYNIIKSTLEEVLYTASIGSYF